MLAIQVKTKISPINEGMLASYSVTKYVLV